MKKINFRSYKYSIVFLMFILVILCFTGCSDNKVSTDNVAVKNNITPVITEEQSNITDEPQNITESVTAPTDIPSAAPTEKTDNVITDTPEPIVTGINNFPSPKVPDPSETYVLTDLYKFYFPSKWWTLVYYSEDDENVVTVKTISEDKEVLKIIPKTDIESAWALLDNDEVKYSQCVFAYDHIFVFQFYNIELTDYTFHLGYYDFLEMIDKTEIINDGVTYAAINSIQPEHIQRYLDYSHDEDIPVEKLDSYGIYGFWGNFRTLSGINLYAFKGTKDPIIDLFIINDGKDIYYTNFPSVKTANLTTVYSFDYNNDGIKEYGIIPFYNNPIEGYIEHEYDHLWISEKVDDLHYNTYELDSTIIIEYIKENITLSVDTSENIASFKLNDDELLDVKCDLQLEDAGYELEYLGVLQAEEYGDLYAKKINKDTFTFLCRASLPVKDVSKECAFDYGSLIFVNVIYSGEGNYDITDTIIRKWGKGLEALDFPDENFINPQDAWTLYYDKYDELVEKAKAQGKTEDAVKVQNYRIISINEDGTVVLRAYYNYFDIDTAGEPPSTDPESYELEEGKTPLGEDIVMKISDDCIFVYYPKDKGWGRFLITFSDLKYIADNYYFSDYIYPLPMHDIDGNWYEYLDDFDCMSIDGVIYYMGEVYHA